MDQSAIVRRVLAENRINAELVLVALVRTLVGRHVDCELVKLGRRLDALAHGGQLRTNSLVAAMDALHEGSGRKPGGDPELAAMQKMLMALLTECQFAAEEAAGIGGDDDPPPNMRLVTD